VRIKGRRLLIAVEDDGQGFDWRTAWSNPAPPSDCSGRGIEILRKYSNGVHYNDRGNAMTIIKRLG
jgi:serine/threonine-protein kinase RsbW